MSHISSLRDTVICKRTEKYKKRKNKLGIGGCSPVTKHLPSMHRLLIYISTTKNTNKINKQKNPIKTKENFIV
jgi:hypothetical protein